MSAISHYHKMSQLQDPTTVYPTIKLLAGVRNVQASPPDQRRPITRSILLALITVLSVCAPSSYETQMYKSMYTMMYYACLRASEALITDTPQHNLALSNISMLPGSHELNLTLTSYTHSSTVKTTLRIESTTGPDCPVQALKSFLSLRTHIPGPLFMHEGKPVSRKPFTATLRACLQYLNLSPTNFNIHSFRIGRSTDMAEQNVPHDTIQRIGHWKSNAYHKYIRSATDSHITDLNPHK
jgi:hypothetical protein